MGNIVFLQNVRKAFNNLINNTANEIKITSSFSLLVLMAEIIFLTLYLILPKLAKSATDKNKGDELAVIKKKENEKEENSEDEGEERPRKRDRNLGR